MKFVDRYISSPENFFRITAKILAPFALATILTISGTTEGNSQVVPPTTDNEKPDSTLYLPLVQTPPEFGAMVPVFGYPFWWQNNDDPALDKYMWDNFAQMKSQLKNVRAIISPTGPDGSVQPMNVDYQRGISDLVAAGVGMSGYVDTAYGNTNITDIKKILENVEEYWESYPDDVVCCMLDQVFANDTDPEELTRKFEYYKSMVEQLGQAAAEKGKKIEIIFNPGQRIDQRFYYLADKTIIFEGTFADWMSYEPDDYILLNPTKAVVLVHTTPTEAEMQQAVDRAVSFGIQLVYVGSGTKVIDPPQDPWVTAPLYLQNEASYIQFKNFSQN